MRNHVIALGGKTTIYSTSQPIIHGYPWAARRHDVDDGVATAAVNQHQLSLYLARAIQMAVASIIEPPTADVCGGMSYWGCFRAVVTGP